MFIGSNNSLTHLKPKNKWWFENILNLGKCQEVDYQIQYLFYGVRLFDFKLFVDHNNHIIVKNGSYEYPMFSFYEILDFLDKKGDAIVLITLDSPHWYYTKHMIQLVKLLNPYMKTLHFVVATVIIIMKHCIDSHG